jgi:hypothetical protein
MERAYKTLRTLKSLRGGSIRDMHMEPPPGVKKKEGLCGFAGPLDAYRSLDQFGYSPR